MATILGGSLFAEQTTSASVHIGCAGWNLPGEVHARFPEKGSHLQRYSAVFPAVEINSCFYRPHRPSTYARWSDSVPDFFRFAAKMPKAITHEMHLRNTQAALEKFIGEVGQLKHKLACLLVQLPPRLRYDASAAHQFFSALRTLVAVDVVCEPRHASWFAPDAAGLLAEMAVEYVRADPSVAPVPEPPDGARMLYLRLHGSPQMYHSAYSETYLDCLAAEIAYKAHAGQRVWCVFDNTASGAAVPNALSLLERLQGRVPAVPASRR